MFLQSDAYKAGWAAGFLGAATCNEINRLSKPLQSHFRRLRLPKYSIEQFLQIAVKVCPKLSEETTLIIAETWEEQGEIRDVISLSKLVKKHDGSGEIADISNCFLNLRYIVLND
jgi:hypothetical protein